MSNDPVGQEPVDQEPTNDDLAADATPSEDASEQLDYAAPPEPSSLRLVLTMSVAGLVAGLMLVGVYLVTLPRIQQNRYDAMQIAITQVLDGSESVETWVVRGDALVPYEGPPGVLPEEEAIFSGHDAEGGLIGYAVPAEGAGFQDTVGLIYGYDPVREVVVGMAVLECKETPGLGDKIIFDPVFLASFAALAVAPAIVGTKDGRAAPNEVDLISGATISSEAVIAIINDSIARWQPLLLPPGGED